MKKYVVLCIFLVVAMVAAAPANLDVKRLHSAVTMNVDGTLGEMDESYFIDSLTSGNNCFAWDVGWDWATAKFNYMLYASHDDAKVYFAMKTLHNVYLESGSSTGCSDAFKINPGGQAMAVYIFFNGSVVVNPSCPYTQGSTLFAGANVTGNGTGLPTIEFSLDKSVIDPFGMGTFQLSVGFEEGDSPSSDCMKTIYGGVGVEYTGNKQDWVSNPWDNPLYYPTFTLTEVIANQSAVTVKSAEMISASPNPFMPSTTIAYNVKNNGLLKIYDVAGKVVHSASVKSGAGKIQWDATDLASGIYVARLISGKNVLNTRLFLTR